VTARVLGGTRLAVLPLPVQRPTLVGEVDRPGAGTRSSRIASRSDKSLADIRHLVELVATLFPETTLRHGNAGNVKVLRGEPVTARVRGTLLAAYAAGTALASGKLRWTWRRTSILSDHLPIGQGNCPQIVKTG
jgi:hypothetical protein